MTLNVYASLFEDDLDDVSNRLDAALLEAAAACVRPEPIAEIIELPEQAARKGSDAKIPLVAQTFFRLSLRRG